MSTMTENSPEEIGARLTAAREHAELSKRKLARLAGVSEQQLRQWERGDHIPTVVNLAKLLPHIGGTFEHYLIGPKC